MISPLGMSVTATQETAFGYDCGTGDGKDTTGKVIGNFLLATNSLVHPHQICTMLIDGTDVGAWHGEALANNFARLRERDYRAIDAIGVTGQGNRPLSIYDKKSGEPLVAFYNGAILNYADTSENQANVASAGIDVVTAEPQYSWKKAKALTEPHILKQITSAIGRELSFDEIGIEPLASTLVWLMLGIRIGFTDQEFKGITSRTDAGPEDVHRTLSTFGYAPDQYVVTESSIDRENRLVTFGDFNTTLEYVRNLQDLALLPSDAIIGEMDSVFKFFTRAEASSMAAKRYAKATGMAYSLQDNGAIINKILKQYVLTNAAGYDINSYSWYAAADAAVGDAIDTIRNPDKARYMYFPYTVRKSHGILWDLEQQKPVAFKHLGNIDPRRREEIAAAMNAGAVLEATTRIGAISRETGRKRVLLTGGYTTNKAQRNNLVLLGNALSEAELNGSLVSLPDQSYMIAAKAASVMHNRQISSPDALQYQDLTSSFAMKPYADKWHSLRDRAGRL